MHLKKKWKKGLTRHVTKEVIYIVDKHEKIFCPFFNHRNEN